MLRLKISSNLVLNLPHPPASQIQSAEIETLCGLHNAIHIEPRRVLSGLPLLTKARRQPPAEWYAHTVPDFECGRSTADAVFYRDEKPILVAHWKP